MSEMINLNDDSFNVDSSVVFNNGEAGKAENVSISVEKKPASDTNNTPDYKVIYTDQKGGTVNEGYYYLDDKHAKFKDHLKYQGAALRHLLHAAFGEETPIPEFANTKEMLDKCMTQLSQVPAGKLFRLAVNYGTETRPSTYLRVRRYPVFIEPMSVAASESRIVFTTDLLKRPVADESPSDAVTSFGTASTSVGSDEPKADMSGFDTPEGGQKSDLPF